MYFIEFVMLRDKLDKILGEASALTPPSELSGLDLGVFDELNAHLLVLLEGATDRLGRFRKRVEVRRGMQGLYKRMGEIEPAIKLEIWREQRDFYPELIHEIQQYMGEDEHSKVTFSLTVAELLFLLRLFIESGIIQTDTLRPILEYLSEYTQTRKGHKLSFASLQKKYSRAEPATKQRVKRLLQGLATRVDTT